MSGWSIQLRKSKLEMKKRNFIDKLNDAIEGLISIFREHRNMKLHLLIATLILSSGIFLGLGKTQLIILILAISLIMFAEMVNSCLEMMLDFVHPQHHPMLKRIKNALAGSVLFTGIVAYTVTYFIFNPYLQSPLINGFQRLKGAHWYLTFFVLLVVVSIVVVTKVIFHKGRPLRGGIPSGHSALAFSIWTMITILKPEPLLSMLIFILALMISASRLREGIHNIWEIILGSVLGFLTTLIIFQFFR